MKAYLDGQILEADSGAHWQEVSGVEPYTLDLEVEAGAADALFNAGKPHESSLTLDYSDEGLGIERIQGLTILGTSPGSMPYTLQVQVKDPRWEWHYGPRYRRSFNVRRKTGQVKRVGQGAPIGAQELQDDVAYATWSLRSGTKKWDPEDVLKDALDFVVKNTKGLSEWEDRDGVLGKLKFPTIEGVEINANPDVAVAQVLAELGGMVGVYFDGGTKKLILYNRVGGDERILVGLKNANRTRTRGVPQGHPQVFPEPVWAVQNRKKERAAKVRVHFTRAPEFRLDHVETDVGSATASRGGSVAVPRLDAVIELPEDITILGRNVLESTWVKLTDYLTYLSGRQPTGLPPLTVDLINKLWLHQGLEAYAAPFNDPSGVWGYRIPAIRQSYRAAYQLREPMRNMLRSIRAYRVAIEDQETKSKGASPIYVDFAEWLTWRAIGSKTANQQPALHQIVKNRYANTSTTAGGSIVGTKITSLKRAPARLQVLDEELGIFIWDLVFDHRGLTSRYERSALKNDSIPSEDPSQPKAWLQEGELRADHEWSTIVTVTPAAPNDSRVFHVEEVTPAQAQPFMQGATAGDAEGPTMDVYIAPTLTVARFGWDEEKATQMWEAISHSAKADEDVSKAFGVPINLDELQKVARSEAARYYLSVADHVEGELTTGYSGDLTIRGTARSVRHVMAPGDGGGGLTVVDLPPEPPKVDLAALLPREVRALVEGHVQP